MHFLRKLYLLIALIVVSPIHPMEAQQEQAAISTIQAAISTIIELNSIHDIPKHIDPTTLTNNDWVIFDLDNTVMKQTEESVFSDHGLNEWAMHHAQALGLTVNDAYQQLLPTWFEQQKQATVHLLEPYVVKLINTLQSQGVIVFALTSRSRPVIDSTLGMVQSIGIDFSRTCPHLPALCFCHLPHKLEGEQSVSVSVYQEGIAGCGTNGKGPVLETLLTQAPQKPQRILFFDDLLKHVRAVKGVAEKLNIEFYGFRYGFLDEHVKQFKIEDHLHTIPEEIRNTYVSKQTQVQE